MAKNHLLGNTESQKIKNVFNVITKKLVLNLKYYT